MNISYTLVHLELTEDDLYIAMTLQWLIIAVIKNYIHDDSNPPNNKNTISLKKKIVFSWKNNFKSVVLESSGLSIHYSLEIIQFSRILLPYLVKHSLSCVCLF